MTSLRFAASVAALLLAAAPPPAPPAPPAPGDPAPPAPRAIITGANRGLGLEFARQLRAAGWDVVGTARDPKEAAELRTVGATVLQLDVTDQASVDALAAEIGDLPVDLLINNAGTGGRVQKLEELDPDEAREVFEVNCLGPMRVTKALLPALRRGQKKLVVNITSALGSIERNTGGGYYGYRESKAALNMFTRSLAAELGPEKFICIALSPGWVQTRMGGPAAQLTPEQSITAMRAVIAKLGAADNGSYFSHTGERLPW